MSSFVQTAGAAHLGPGWAERRITRACSHWTRKQSEGCFGPRHPNPASQAGLHTESPASFLPYGVSGDTGNAGVGETDSLPLLVGEKILPSTASRSGGYAVTTV